MATKKQTDRLAEELSELSGLPKAAFANADHQLRVRTDRFVRIYANNLRLQQGPWDMSITFGEVVGEKDGEPVIEETVKVTISREISKVLSILLQHQLSAFEEAQGEIRIPLAVVPETAKGKKKGPA